MQDGDWVSIIFHHFGILDLETFTDLDTVLFLITFITLTEGFTMDFMVEDSITGFMDLTDHSL